MSAGAPPIVLFDGECGLCVGSVRFLIRRDPQGALRFASLGSPVAEQLLGSVDGSVGATGADGIVLIEGGRIHDRSTAALRIAGYLRFPWPLARVFLLVPRPIRDAIYGLVARRRHRWSGDSPVCAAPPRDIAERFLR